MPANQSKNEGNDDQVFWAYSMIQAAEYKFPDPPSDKPGWLAMTQSVFNQFVKRFNKEVDDNLCGGGMRWQIYPWLNGWTYKNMASNGGLFHLGARLAVYTKNDTYAQWAEKAFTWMSNSPLLPGDGTVNDGTSITTDPPCKDADTTQWTYNYGIMIAGAAYVRTHLSFSSLQTYPHRSHANKSQMYNYTNGAEKWRNALSSYINKTEIFYPPEYNNTITEPCEPRKLCNADQESFKAYLARWFAVAMQMAPYTRSQILPVLQHSAKAAAQTCVGPSKYGAGNYSCGMSWTFTGWDGIQGVGPQMSALNIISALLVEEAESPYSSVTGGTSQGDPGLGTGTNDPVPTEEEEATTGDKVGAGFLTAFCVIFVVGGGWWLVQ